MHLFIYLFNKHMLNAYWRPLLVWGNQQPNMAADPPTWPPSLGLYSPFPSPPPSPFERGRGTSF